MINIERANKGTLTTANINGSFAERLSSPEEHNSTSFLREIFGEIEHPSNENIVTPRIKNKSKNVFNIVQTSNSDDEEGSSSSMKLYEMKSVKNSTDIKSPPLKIKFKFHKNVAKGKKRCRFADEVQFENIQDEMKFKKFTSLNNCFSPKPTPVYRVNSGSDMIPPGIPASIKHETNLMQDLPNVNNNTLRSGSFMENLKRSFSKICQSQKTHSNTSTPINNSNNAGNINNNNSNNASKNDNNNNNIDNNNNTINSDSPKSVASVTEERMEVYYFDHGSAEYFRTTDCPPNVLSEVLAQQTTYYATRFWAEIFGSLHIGVTFFLTFILQTYRFLLFSIVRAIFVGILQITSDYFLKPLITVLFNGYLQPPLVLIYNLLSSIKDMLEPIAEIIDMFLKPFTNMIRAFRLMSVKLSKESRPSLSSNEHEHTIKQI